MDFGLDGYACRMTKGPQAGITQTEEPQALGASLSTTQETKQNMPWHRDLTEVNCLSMVEPGCRERAAALSAAELCKFTLRPTAPAAFRNSSK